MLKGFCVSFSPKIHNFLSVLAELDIFSHDILSQNYHCRCDGSAEIHNQNEESEFIPSALVLCLLLATSMLHDANTFNACGEKRSGWQDIFVCLFCCFTSKVNSYGHGRMVSSLNYTFFWASLNKQLTSTLSTYFRV